MFIVCDLVTNTDKVFVEKLITFDGKCLILSDFNFCNERKNFVDFID